MNCNETLVTIFGLDTGCSLHCTGYGYSDWMMVWGWNQYKNVRDPLLRLVTIVIIPFVQSACQVNYDLWLCVAYVLWVFDVLLFAMP